MANYSYSGVIISALVCYLAFRAVQNVQLEPVAFELPAAPPLEKNRYISTYGSRLFNTQAIGAESFAERDGWIYTGLFNGQIIAFHPSTLERKVITRTGDDHPQCGSKDTEIICGRPLAMKFDKSGALLVADGYKGLLSVDVKTGQKTVLSTGVDDVDGGEEEGGEFVFLNGLAIDENDESGTVYLTDSSSRHRRNSASYEILEGIPTGRLIEYNPKTRKARVLLKDLPFPNGLCFTHDGRELLIALWSRMQVKAYNVATSAVRPFATLPGPPDNISLRPNGKTYWVALSFRRAANEFSKIDFLASRPWLRKAAAWLFEKNFFTTLFGEKYGIVVEVDGEGKVVSSLQEQDKTFSYFSEVLELGSTLYLGSFQNSFIVTVPVPESKL